MNHINPITGNSLKRSGDYLIDFITEKEVAHIVNDIPRFIKNHQDYAQKFGYQWNKWNAVLSDSRNPKSGGAKHKLLVKRTCFEQFETNDKSILECGCGGGDDTEVLLGFGFGEIHSFDISTAIERAKKFISDTRVHFLQASIFSNSICRSFV